MTGRRLIGVALLVLATLEQPAIGAKQAKVSHTDSQHSNPPLPLDLVTAEWPWQSQPNRETYYFFPYTDKQPQNGADAFFGISSGMWVAIFTFFLVAATFVQAILILRAEALTRQSLRLSLRQGVRAKIDNIKRSAETSKALDIADANAKAAADAAKAMERLAEEAERTRNSEFSKEVRRRRETAAAMRQGAEANKIARETGQAQVRAYLICETSNYRIDGNMVYCWPTFKNTGRSPAIEVWAEGVLSIVGEKTVYRSEHQATAISNIAAEKSENGMFVFSGIGAEYIARLREGQSFSIDGDIRWKDVFGTDSVWPFTLMKLIGGGRRVVKAVDITSNSQGKMIAINRAPLPAEIFEGEDDERPGSGEPHKI